VKNIKKCCHFHFLKNGSCINTLDLEENAMSVKDIIRSVKERDPVSFQASVEAELAARMTDALDNKKIEIAQSVFTPDEPEEELTDD